MGRPGGPAAALLVLVLVLVSGCSSGEPAPDEPSPSRADASGESSDVRTTDPGEATSSAAPGPAPDPVSLPGLAAQRHVGDRLRLGSVREQTPAYTSYDVAYRVRSTGPGTGPDGSSLRITGVLNVPRGEGPFPAVVLAHGYIDPAVYVSGQGMTRERGWWAERDYLALHVDYRNHAGSDDDPDLLREIRLGYVVDVIGAVDALRRADLPVDDGRIALMGRSMGGGVVQKAAAVAPDQVGAVASWASVSSLEAENFDHFVRGEGEREPEMTRRGLPEQAPAFWRGVSPRPSFDRIEAPVLLVHGTFDETCPPRWARATQRALRAAGVRSTLAWYDDAHAFGPAFEAAMSRTHRFFRRTL